ncbi:uncharacterized protein LOC110863146 [Folsomia candida]|uniref:DNA repair and recombination protein RDH54 n=1 Tax=Folsomia candida TaxID=158441 RepID=A0A226F5D3_FOLCA|nr:uncharacterized protein LOC110863146 [Folsomia candida]OXA65015.1 DNA repair and recombination protein RDH54 [Folsomia candida]
MESTEEGTQSNNKVSLTIKHRRWGRQPQSEPPAKYLKTNFSRSSTLAPVNSSSAAATCNEVHQNTGEHVLSTFDRMMTESLDNGNPYHDFLETSSSEDELASSLVSPVKIQREEAVSISQKLSIPQDKVRMEIRSPQGWNQRTMLISKRKVLGSPIDREKLVKQFSSSEVNECGDMDDSEIEPKIEKDECDDEKTFYAVMFSKPSMKKHKTWDEDGFMVTDGINFVLKDSNGEVIERSSKIKLTEEMLSEYKPFRFGGKEVQIQEQLSENPFCGARSSPLSALNAGSVCIQGHENNEEFVGRTTGSDEYDTPYEQVFENSSVPQHGPTKIYSSDVVDEDDVEEIHLERFYSAMFSKPSTKKHKTWDEDGFIVTDGTNVILKNINGGIVGSSKFQLTEEMLSECKPFKLGSKEVQIQEQLPYNPFPEKLCESESY